MHLCTSVIIVILTTSNQGLTRASDYHFWCSFWEAQRITGTDAD